jgi:hypothetical protein
MAREQPLHVVVERGLGLVLARMDLDHVPVLSTNTVVGIASIPASQLRFDDELW